MIFPGGIVRALGLHGDATITTRSPSTARNEPFRTRMLDFTGINALIGTPEMLALGKRYETHAPPSDKKPGAPVTPLDPVTLAVLNGRLVQIADEMDATLYRSAFNPIIAEAHDACHGLYHAETGATLVQGTSGLPIFVGAMAFAVKAVIDKVARDGGLEPGDTYIFNDPYDGGTHLNDFRLVRPLMRGGKVFVWLASVGHWLDVGGNVPGNFNAKATESFQEGFRVPPVKLIRAGVLQQDIIDILGANSRVPQSNWGDLNGQLNALDLGEKRLHALLDEYGDDTITAATGAAQRPRRGADARQHRGAAGRHLLLRRLPRQRRRHRCAAAHRARPDDCGRPHDARFLALRAALRRAAQHRALDHGRVLLCSAEAPVHRRAGQRRLPRADRVRHSRHDTAGREGAEAGRRLHRDHPARDRRHFRRVRQGRARARQRQPVRDHQCAVARRLARARPALGDVLLLRRRARRQSRGRRAQSQQQPDLDRDHSADRNSRSRFIR